MHNHCDGASAALGTVLPAIKYQYCSQLKGGHLIIISHYLYYLWLSREVGGDSKCSMQLQPRGIPPGYLYWGNKIIKRATASYIFSNTHNMHLSCKDSHSTKDWTVACGPCVSGHTPGQAQPLYQGLNM